MSTADAVPTLTPTQLQALILLMAEARELTNNDMRDLAGFTLTGADNAKLIKLGFVETDKSHRPYSHQLTDKGWHYVRELSHADPPKRSGSAVRSLLVLLTNVHRSLDRLQISQGDFFKRSPAMATATSESSAVAVPSIGTTLEPAHGSTDVEAAIRTAYHELASAPGEWVGLADLRDRLGHIERSDIDDVLRGMVRQSGVRIIPVANTKALQPRDRAAALRIGDEDNHAMSIFTS